MATKSQYMVAVVNEEDITKTGVTFALNATDSSVFTCGGTPPAAMFLPSNWTTCTIQFLVCKTPNGTFVPLNYFDGSDYNTISARASKAIPMIPSLFHSQLYLKIRCSTAQLAACTVDFSLVPYYQGIHG